MNHLRGNSRLGRKGRTLCWARLTRCRLTGCEGGLCKTTSRLGPFQTSIQAQNQRPEVVRINLRHCSDFGVQQIVPGPDFDDLQKGPARPNPCSGDTNPCRMTRVRHKMRRRLERACEVTPVILHGGVTPDLWR